MNAYDLLIAGSESANPAGHMALGHLTHDLTTSPHAAAVAAAGPWPAAWPATRGYRTIGAAIITPGGTMIILTRDDSALELRGAVYSATVVHAGKAPVKGVDMDAVPALVARGVPPLRSAVWALLGEWGTEKDHATRDGLLG